MSKSIDLYVLYRIIDRLATPFDEMEAYEQGIIDDDGKLLKKPKTKDEKDAYGPFDRFIINLKRILYKAGLKSKFSTYAAATFLIKEADNLEYWAEREDESYERLIEEMRKLNPNKDKTLNEFLKEDTPTNATGAAVAGTGDDTMTWIKQQNRKRYGKPINGMAFLKRRRQKEMKEKGYKK